MRVLPADRPHAGGSALPQLAERGRSVGCLARCSRVAVAAPGSSALVGGDLGARLRGAGSRRGQACPPRGGWSPALPLRPSSAAGLPAEPRDRRRERAPPGRRGGGRGLPRAGGPAERRHRGPGRRAARRGGGPAAKLSKPLPPLSVAMVPGGQLAQYVALTVTEPPREVWHGVRPEDRSRRVLGFLGRIHSILFQAVRDSGCRTLAMPTLCTGGIGIPVQLVAIAAVCAVQADFCEHPADPLQVRVACYEEDHIPSFQVIKDTVMEHFFEPERTKRILTSVLDNMGDFEDM